MKKFAVLLGVWVAVSFLSAGSVRAELITDWNYSVTSVFTTWTDENGKTYDIDTFTDRASGKSGFTLENDGTNLNWTSVDSKGTRTSGAELTSFSGIVSTDGEFQNALTMTHNNQTIGTVAPTPRYMDIGVVVTLAALTQAGEELSFDVNLTLSLGFIETPNQGFAGYYGTQDDIFYVRDVSAATTQFIYGDILYDITLESSFQELSDVGMDTLRYQLRNDATFTSWDTGSAIYGWTTKEGQSATNAIELALQVRHETIPPATPEPGTMMIFGIASLVGLPLVRKLKRTATGGRRVSA